MVSNRSKKGELRQLPRETLAGLLEVCLNNLRVCDGLWYLGVEDRHGTEEATAIDHQVWERLTKVEVEALKQTFNLNGGIEALLKAIELSPSWMIAGEYQLEQPSPSNGVLRILSCRSQEARLRMGREPFPCRVMEEAIFSVFAGALDPRIKVSCAFSPPERRSSPWCEWHFQLEE